MDYNFEIWGESDNHVNALLPLIDLINHYVPLTYDLEDITRFKLKLEVRDPS